MTHLKEVFCNKHESEEAKRRLYICKQGNKTIEEFNALFNSLVYAVDLSEESRCDVYERALHPEILKIAVVRGNWKSTTLLKDKQSLAASAAEAQEKISSINQSIPYYHSRPHQQGQQRHSAPPPPVQINSGPAPMDLDGMATEGPFDFLEYRRICRLHKICHRCGLKFEGLSSTRVTSVLVCVPSPGKNTSK